MVMVTSVESAALGDPFSYSQSNNVAYQTFAVIEYEFFRPTFVSRLLSSLMPFKLNLLKSL